MTKYEDLLLLAERQILRKVKYLKSGYDPNAAEWECVLVNYKILKSNPDKNNRTLYQTIGTLKEIYYNVSPAVFIVCSFALSRTTYYRVTRKAFIEQLQSVKCSVEDCSNKLAYITQSLNHSENLSAKDLCEEWKIIPVSASSSQNNSHSHRAQVDEPVGFCSSVAQELFTSGLLDPKAFKETLMNAVDGEHPSEEVKRLWESSTTGVSIAFLVRLF
jgi:hypothetical protein